MSYYKYRTEGKASEKLAEKKQHRLEGSVELAPNIDYKSQEVYRFEGLGSVFDGNYKIQKVTKRIDTSGMAVSADVVQLKAVSGGKTNIKAIEFADLNTKLIKK